MYQIITFIEIKRGLNDWKKGKYLITISKSLIVDNIDIPAISPIKSIKCFFTFFDFKMKKLKHKINGINGHTLPKKWYWPFKLCMADTPIRPLKFSSFGTSEIVLCKTSFSIKKTSKILCSMNIDEMVKIRQAKITFG